MAVDGDGQRGRVGGETRGDGVVDGVGQRLAVVKAVHGGVGVIERIGVGAIRVNHERAKHAVASDGGTDVAVGPFDLGDGLRTGAAGVVVEDVAGRGVGRSGVF